MCSAGCGMHAGLGPAQSAPTCVPPAVHLAQGHTERRNLADQLLALAKVASDCCSLAHTVSSSCLLSLLLQTALDLAGTSDVYQAGQPVGCRRGDQKVGCPPGPLWN